MPPKKKLRQTELTFFEKAEKTDTGTIATYLFTYLQTNSTDNVTSWVEDWRQAQICRHPHKPGPCTPITVCLQTHVKPLLHWTCICVVFTAQRYYMRKGGLCYRGIVCLFVCLSVTLVHLLTGLNSAEVFSIIL